MMRSQADLAITAAVAGLACASAALGAPVAVTAVLGLALLAAPGYLFGELLFGSRLGGLERTSVMTALALCVPVLGGLVLFAIGAPLHRAAWLGLLAGATGVGDFALLLRRRTGRARVLGWPQAGKRPPVRCVVAFGAAIVIAVCALGLARAGAAIQHNPRFTQLWLAPPSGNAATANLGVGNYEGTTTRYRLVLVSHGHPSANWNLTLASGQTWHRSPVISGQYSVTAYLYRLPDLTHPYRQVFIGSGGARS
jgi:hypothetical protein